MNFLKEIENFISENGFTKGISFISIVVIIFIIYKLFVAVINKKISKLDIKNALYRRNKTLLKLMKSVARYIMFIIYIVVILIYLGVDITAIFAGAGVLGIALGFGAKDLVQDFISGVFILTERQYDVGDIIQVNGFKGEVIELGFKSTILQNWVGDVFVVGNGSISEVINYSKENSVAIVKINIEKESDIEVVKEVINSNLSDALSVSENALEAPIYKGISDITVDYFEILVTVLKKTECHYEIERIMRYKLIEIFKANNIKLASAKVNVRSDKNDI